MKLIELYIENFKRIRKFSLAPNGANTVIFGDNATGKTTIADAYFWLLFGKDSAGRSDFDLLPMDGNGQIIEGLEASVTGKFSGDDGKEFSLRRAYHQVFTRKNGEAEQKLKGNTTDFFINDIPKLQKDYQAFVAGICDEKTFAMLTDPDMFPGTPSTTYYCNTSDVVFIVRTYDATGAFSRSIATVNNGSTFTTASGEYYISITLSDKTNYAAFQTAFLSGTIKPFICLNSVTDKNYAPFVPESPSGDYPSQPHGVTKNTVNGTDYVLPRELFTGDSYDLISGRGTTVNIKALFAGITSETWIYETSSTSTAMFNTSQFFTGLKNDSVGGKINCSHFMQGTTASDYSSDRECIFYTTSGSNGFVRIKINKSRLTGWSDSWTNGQKVTAFKTWLAGQQSANTPVVARCDLATPEAITGTPQRILTDGHTTITNDGGAQMQVGYNTMTGDTVDGGDFNWYNTKKVDGGAFVEPDPVVSLGPDNRYDFKVDDNPVTITGIVYEADNQDYVIGDRTYALHISDNVLIQGDPTAILESLADAMIGFTYLPFTSSWQGNPALQPGDIIQQTDRNGVVYRTIVTNSSYAYRGVCNLSAKGASEIAHGFQSAQTKKATQLLRLIHEKEVEISSLDQAVLNATSLIAGALGSHWIDGDTLPDEKYHGNVFIADNPDITKAMKVWRWNLGGFGHSNNGVDGPYTTAITADDSIVANMITASMIKTGRLESLTNPNVYFDLDAGVLCASKLVSSEDGYTDVYADVGLQGWEDGSKTKGVRLFTKDGAFLSLTSSSTDRSAVIHSPGTLTLAANASTMIPWGDGNLLTLESFGDNDDYIVASVANGPGISIVHSINPHLDQIDIRMPDVFGYTIDKDGWNGPIYGVYGRTGDILPGATIHVKHGIIAGWDY